jgi:hypothetical protein
MKMTVRMGSQGINVAAPAKGTSPPERTIAPDRR